MATRDDFLSYLQANPDDWSTYAVFSDWLQDQGLVDESYIYRWMLGKRKHPVWHGVSRPRWKWVSLPRQGFRYSKYAKVVATQYQVAALPPELSAGLGYTGNLFQFPTWHQAVGWLGKRLVPMRQMSDLDHSYGRTLDKETRT